MSVHPLLLELRLTAWVMTGGEEDATSGLADTNDMAGRRGTEDAVLANEKFLDPVRSTNLCNQLDDLRVPVSAIASNDEESPLYTFGNGEEDGGDEGLAVVGLLEDSDLLAKSRGARSVERVRPWMLSTKMAQGKTYF